MGDRPWARWGWGGSGVYWRPWWRRLDWPPLSAAARFAYCDRYYLSDVQIARPARRSVAEAIEFLVAMGDYSAPTWTAAQVAEMFGEDPAAVTRHSRWAFVEYFGTNCPCLRLGCTGACAGWWLPAGVSRADYKAAVRRVLAIHTTPPKRAAPITVEELRARTGRAPDPQPRAPTCCMCERVMDLDGDGRCHECRDGIRGFDAGRTLTMNINITGQVFAPKTLPSLAPLVRRRAE